MDRLCCSVAETARNGSRQETCRRLHGAKRRGFTAPPTQYIAASQEAAWHNFYTSLQLHIWGMFLLLLLLPHGPPLPHQREQLPHRRCQPGGVHLGDIARGCGPVPRGVPVLHSPVQSP